MLVGAWMVGVRLVVAQIHDGGISFVADTKITKKSDETWTRQVFRNACPKLMMLRGGVTVGITGDNPTLCCRNLSDFGTSRSMTSSKRWSTWITRHSSSPHSTLRLSSGRCPPGLPRNGHWLAVAGLATTMSTSFSSSGATSGRKRYSVGPAFRLMSSMQWLLSFNPVPSVGGYLTRVATGGYLTRW